MPRTYEVRCGREPELPVLARLATPVLRGLTGEDDEVVVVARELRFGSASVRVGGARRLAVVAGRPEDEPLALVTAVAATLEYDGCLIDDLPAGQRQLAYDVFRSRYGAVTEHLGVLLAEMGTEASALAGEALTAGTVLSFAESTWPAWAARSRFGRRERLSRRAGQESVDFEPALRALGAYPGVALVQAQIDDRARERYLFELFLTPDLTQVVACFGVARPQACRAADAPPWSRLDEIVLRTLPEPGEKAAQLLEEGVPAVAAGLVTGLEKYLATRHWTSFAKYAALVPSFPSPEAAGPLTDALDRGRSDPFVTAPLVAVIEEALAAVRVRP